MSRFQRDACDTKPVVAILNNQILPYRIPLFEELDARGNISPFLLYSSRRHPDREWSLTGYLLSYQHKILPGIAIRRPKPNYNEWRTIWLNPTLFPELVRLRPKVVIGYEYSAPAMTALFYSRVFRCKYITWTDMTSHAERVLTSGQRLTRKLSDRNSHAYIATNHAGVQNLLARGQTSDKVILAPQPLDIAKFQREADRTRAESEPHAPTVLYAGYLNERKGVSHLIAAFPTVLQQVPDAKLVLVGSGPLESELRAQIARAGIQDKVTMTGFLEPTELPRIYAQADVFVLPTLEDVFGVVITEAIASRLALVCSEFAGVASHLTDEENAFIINPEDHTQLAERVIRLLKDEALRNRFVENSQAVLGQFSPPHVAEQFEKAVEFVLHNG